MLTLGGSSRTRHWRPKASLGPAPHSGGNGAASLVSGGAPWGKGWGPGAPDGAALGEQTLASAPPSPCHPTKQRNPTEGARQDAPEEGERGATPPHTEGPRQGTQRGSPLADVAAEREGPESPGQSLGLRPHEERPRGPASPKAGAGESLWSNFACDGNTSSSSPSKAFYYSESWVDTSVTHTPPAAPPPAKDRVRPMQPAAAKAHGENPTLAVPTGDQRGSSQRGPEPPVGAVLPSPRGRERERPSGRTPPRGGRAGARDMLTLGGSSRTRHWRPKASLGPAPHSGGNGAASLRNPTEGARQDAPEEGERGATPPHTEGPRQGTQRGSPLADVAAEREGPESPGQSLGLRPHEERPRGPASPKAGAGESLWASLSLEDKRHGPADMATPAPGAQAGIRGAGEAAGKGPRTGRERGVSPEHALPLFSTVVSRQRDSSDAGGLQAVRSRVTELGVRAQRPPSQFIPLHGQLPHKAGSDSGQHKAPEGPDGATGAPGGPEHQSPPAPTAREPGCSSEEVPHRAVPGLPAGPLLSSPSALDALAVPRFPPSNLHCPGARTQGREKRQRRQKRGCTEGTFVPKVSFQPMRPAEQQSTRPSRPSPDAFASTSGYTGPQVHPPSPLRGGSEEGPQHPVRGPPSAALIRPEKDGKKPPQGTFSFNLARNRGAPLCTPPPTLPPLCSVPPSVALGPLLPAHQGAVTSSSCRTTRGPKNAGSCLEGKHGVTLPTSGGRKIISTQIPYTITSLHSVFNDPVSLLLGAADDPGCLGEPWSTSGYTGPQVHPPSPLRGGSEEGPQQPVRGPPSAALIRPEKDGKKPPQGTFSFNLARNRGAPLCTPPPTLPPLCSVPPSVALGPLLPAHQGAVTSSSCRTTVRPLSLGLQQTQAPPPIPASACQGPAHEGPAHEDLAHLDPVFLTEFLSACGSRPLSSLPSHSQLTEFLSACGSRPLSSLPSHSQLTSSKDIEKKPMKYLQGLWAQEGGPAPGKRPPGSRVLADTATRALPDHVGPPKTPSPSPASDRLSTTAKSTTTARRSSNAQPCSEPRMPPPRAPSPAEPWPLPGTAPRTVSPGLGMAPRRPPHADRHSCHRRPPSIGSCRALRAPQTPGLPRGHPQQDPRGHGEGLAADSALVKAPPGVLGPVGEPWARGQDTAGRRGAAPCGLEGTQMCVNKPRVRVSA
ncbi:collagen alpha-1(I) chain-like [Physeter macrocephalus]|uniref:Collagen alpha-1(I) chain-like n=1 Tax=Physeter macrocephalus TaxID=9755 RepID=A0A2Y9T7L3_PHYMC|nr:collagen alpha-1(I) chain-like [Physeter catodon]|eukprot:XP_023984104.1 proline-rich protein 36-like [Physeter catodon]